MWTGQTSTNHHFSRIRMRMRAETTATSSLLENESGKAFTRHPAPADNFANRYFLEERITDWIIFRVIWVKIRQERRHFPPQNPLISCWLIEQVLLTSLEPGVLMESTSHDDHVRSWPHNMSMRTGQPYFSFDFITSPPRGVSSSSDCRHVRSLLTHYPRKNSVACA